MTVWNIASLYFKKCNNHLDVGGFTEFSLNNSSQLMNNCAIKIQIWYSSRRFLLTSDTWSHNYYLIRAHKQTNKSIDVLCLTSQQNPQWQLTLALPWICYICPRENRHKTEKNKPLFLDVEWTQEAQVLLQYCGNPIFQWCTAEAFCLAAGSS